MSGKKCYRTSNQVTARISKEAQKKAAAAASIAEELKRVRDNKLRTEQEQREAEVIRLRQVAQAESAELERKKNLSIDLEIQAILANCKVEIACAKSHWDGRFPMDAFINNLADIQELTSAKRDIASVRAAAEKLKENLLSQVAKINEFHRKESECTDVISAIASEKAVSLFKSVEIQNLNNKHERVKSVENLRETPIAKTNEQLDEIIASSKEILDSAFRLEAQYESRNKLLEATISSIKGMGFYVTDPTLLNAENPLGPVVLTADRGTERIVVTVPLSGEIDSDWQGLPHGDCLNDFTTLLKKLETSGFPCEVSDQKLIPPPNLIKKGAKELPNQSGEKGRM